MFVLGMVGRRQKSVCQKRGR